MQVGMLPTELDDLFEKFDLNSDERISYMEFVEVLEASLQQEKFISLKEKKEGNAKEEQDEQEVQKEDAEGEEVKEQGKKELVILVGPPGCGKGTHAPKLKEVTQWAHVSTGDMLREAVKNQTEYGMKAKEAMEGGGLVTDEIVISIIKEKMQQPECSQGIILDGFPRNLIQAQELDKMLEDQGEKVTHVVEFQVDDSILTERICGRRIHQASGRSYHIKFNPPKVEGVDDETGEPLIQRKDDCEETLAKRLFEYHNSTKPILEHY